MRSGSPPYRGRRSGIATAPGRGAGAGRRPQSRCGLRKVSARSSLRRACNRMASPGRPFPLETHRCRKRRHSADLRGRPGGWKGKPQDPPGPAHCPGLM